MDTQLQLVLYILLSIFVAALVSFCATPLVRILAFKTGIGLDIPKDNRRMHKVPIPRLGGLAIFLGFFISVLLFSQIDRPLRGILLGAVMIVVLGALDDVLQLKALPKFIVQILAAGVAVYYGCRIQYVSNPNLFSASPYVDLGIMSVPISIIWIVAITNSVNFIDGLDGLASGVSAISAGTLLVIALLVSEADIAILMAALLGACLGFIPYNLNPAKIFMGDTGATFLGYILATVSVTGLFKMYTIISFAVPFLVLGLPIFDLCFAVLRRLAKGQNPMTADRGHVHHRLIDMGFNQKQAVAIAYLLTAILGLSAVVLTTSGEAKAMLLLGSVIVVGAIGFEVIYHLRPHHDQERVDAATVESQGESQDDISVYSPSISPEAEEADEDKTAINHSCKNTIGSTNQEEP